MNNVKNSTWFVLGGFVAFLICSFTLPAFSFAGVGITAWDVKGIYWLAFIFLLLAAIAAAVMAFGNSATMPKIGNLSTEMVITGLAALGTLFMLLRTIIKPGTFGIGGLGYSFGGIVCTLLAGLMTYGGFMMMKEKGESLDRFKNMQFSGPGGQQGYAPPPPGYGQPPAAGGYAPPPAQGASYAPPPPPPAAPGAYSPPPPPPPGATPPPPPPPR